ncbi:MAG: YeeE/YedE family protein [Caldimonas sp.]
MSEADFQRLTHEVLALSFTIAVVFGWVAQRSHFCTMGAISDLVITGDWTRMRMWLAAAGTAIIGFNAMVFLGWVDAANSIYAGPRIVWLSAIVGGLMFGVGMVLASGCTSKNLLRAGSGNLKSVVVLMVVALSGFATLKGITAVVRVAALDSIAATVAAQQDLPTLAAALLGTRPRAAAAVLGATLGGALLIGAVYSRTNRSTELVVGGISIGALVVAAWWTSGVFGFVAENPLTLEPSFLATNSHRMEALSFVSAVSYAADYLLFFSDRSKTLTIGIVSAVGLPVGACLYAVFSRSFRWEGFRSVPDLRNHLIGGALMGVGGVTALGCTIGQGLSGLSTLSVTSLLAVAATVTGAVGTVKAQMR